MMSHFRMKKLKKITESRNFQNISVILYPNFTYTYIYSFFSDETYYAIEGQGLLQQTYDKIVINCFGDSPAMSEEQKNPVNNFLFLLIQVLNLAVFTLQSQKSVFKSHGHIIRMYIICTTYSNIKFTKFLWFCRWRIINIYLFLTLISCILSSMACCVHF